MAEWLNTPLIATVVLAVIGAIWAAARWTGKVDGKLGDLTKAVDEIRADIKKIFQRLPDPVVAGTSPLQLTDFGEKIAKSIDAHTWALTLAPTVLPDVEGKRPFEIDTFSQSYVDTRLDDQWKERVARCAYEFGIDRSGVLSVMQVVLREELLHLEKPHEADA